MALISLPIIELNQFCFLNAKRIVVDKGYIKGIMPMDYHL